jgi:hypothetical protein
MYPLQIEDEDAEHAGDFGGNNPPHSRGMEGFALVPGHLEGAWFMEEVKGVCIRPGHTEGT